MSKLDKQQRKEEFMKAYKEVKYLRQDIEYLWNFVEKQLALQRKEDNKISKKWANIMIKQAVSVGKTKARKEIIEEIEVFIAEEMLIENNARRPTSRLTSLAVKINKLKQQ